MADLKQFIAERNEALLSLDKSKIERFATRYDIHLPPNDEAFWCRVHKAICNISSIPFEVRQKSADYLFEHGSTPWMKELDHLYQGKSEMDWYDDETRLLLVRDFGWSCLEPSWECDSCKCKKYCSWHEEDGAANAPD